MAMWPNTKHSGEVNHEQLSVIAQKLTGVEL